MRKCKDERDGEGGEEEKRNGWKDKVSARTEEIKRNTTTLLTKCLTLD